MLMSKFGLTFQDYESWLLEKTTMQFAYGTREILLDYMGIDYSHIFPGIVQHGIGPWEFLESNWPTPRLGPSRRLPLWLYSDKAAELAKKSGAEDVSAIGSPWIYLKAIEEAEKLEGTASSKNRFLVFPKHYSHEVVNNEELQSILTRISKWKIIAQQGELTICLYWTEFLNPNWHRAAAMQEVVITCAGISNTEPSWSLSKSRIDFLPTLRSIMLQHEYIIFENYTSGIFYGTSLGKQIGMFSDGPEEMESQTTRVRREWIRRNLPEMHEQFSYTSRMQEISDEYIGARNRRTPDELVEMLRPIPNVLVPPQYYGEFD